MDGLPQRAPIALAWMSTRLLYRLTPGSLFCRPEGGKRAATTVYNRAPESSLAALWSIAERGERQRKLNV